MTVLNCKRCGAPLPDFKDKSVVECEYCNSRITVPKIDDEKKATMFARADKLLLDCRFDEAAARYEAILADFPIEAEGYWGLLLCKYGIEYVDDPATAKKIPTCHRSSFESVTDDENFKSVMEFADILSLPVYREQAKEIELLRRNIIEVSSKEEPFDIFICYKETDREGDRTEDSVLAQQIYTDLTAQGYKVFFSRITLEDKLGQEYEPYIFAALRSSNIMLVFGTSHEYFTSVWVKNEWSRFLQLIAKGERKTLIPCYKYVDPAFDMPQEFTRLQGQDMSKLGWEQDLIRGIQKILPKSSPRSTETSPSLSPLVDRAYIFLESGDFEKADAYCEKVLDRDPRCATAYLCKLLAELKLRKESDLSQANPVFAANNNFIMAFQFADKELAKRLSGYIESSEKAQKERAKKKREAENAKKIAFIDNCMSLANKFLEQGLFGNAIMEFKKALEKEPSLHSAYFGILLSARQVKNPAELGDFPPLDKDADYINALKYADANSKELYTAVNAMAVINALLRFIEYAKSGSTVLMNYWAGHYKSSALADSGIVRCVDIITENKGFYYISPLMPGTLLHLAELIKDNSAGYPRELAEGGYLSVLEMYEQYMEKILKGALLEVEEKHTKNIITSKSVADICDTVFGALSKSRRTGPRLYRDNVRYSLYVDGQNKSMNSYLGKTAPKYIDPAKPESAITKCADIEKLYVNPLTPFTQKFGAQISLPISKSGDLCTEEGRKLHLLIQKATDEQSIGKYNIDYELKTAYNELSTHSKKEFEKKIEQTLTPTHTDGFVNFVYDLMPDSPKVNLVRLSKNTNNFTAPTVQLSDGYAELGRYMTKQEIATLQTEYRQAHDSLILLLDNKNYAVKAFANGQNPAEQEKWQSYRTQLLSVIDSLKNSYDRTIEIHNQHCLAEKKKHPLKNLFGKGDEVTVPEIRLAAEDGIKMGGTGTVKEIYVKKGQRVQKGEALFTLTAFGSDHTHSAKTAATVSDIFAEEGCDLGSSMGIVLALKEEVE